MIPLGLDRIQLDSAMPLASGVRTATLRQLDAADQAAWARLSAVAAADSIYASDWFVRAVLTHFDAGQRHQLFIVTDAMGEWIGVAVLAPENQWGRIPLLHWTGLANPNQFMGVPLVRPGDETEFWRQLLTQLDWQGRGQAALCLNHLPADHRVTRALFDVARRESRRVEIVADGERAALLSSHTLKTRMDAGLSPKRAARLRSLERKLEREVGEIAVVEAETEAAIEQWIADFLVLEAAGWKGRAGSALASAPDSRALFVDTVRSAHRHGAIRCLSLMTGQRTLAMSSFLRGEGHGFGFKCCFDEEFGSFAPGILLLRRIMTLVSEGPEIQFDSCSSPSEATINALWPERRRMVDLAVGLRAPLAELRFDGAVAARRAWHWWKERAAISSAAV